jgi:hypothetical protein
MNFLSLIRSVGTRTLMVGAFSLLAVPNVSFANHPDDECPDTHIYGGESLEPDVTIRCTSFDLI